MLRSFLRRSQTFSRISSQWLTDEKGKVVVCIGNEAADADSIVSSICYSYFQQNILTETEAHPKIFYVPVVSIERKELGLRRDVELLLQQVGLELEDLICLDDCSFESWRSDDIITVNLLDHNQLSAKVSNLLAPRQDLIHVEEILDHHVDLGSYSYCDGDRRHIAFDREKNTAEVGSACTLVVERFQHTPYLTKDVATLLIGVIALDTINMDPTIGKGTCRDQRAIDILEPVADVNRKSLFETLRDAKIDPTFWMRLSAVDALLLDYKLFHTISPTVNIGISSILIDARSLLEDKSDIAYAVKKYLDVDGLDCLVAMSLVQQPTQKRELVIFSRNPDRLRVLGSFLQPSLSTVSATESATTATATAAAYEAIEGSQDWASIGMLREQGIYVSVYEQGNFKFSRKQIGPLFQEIFQTIHTSP